MTVFRYSGPMTTMEFRGVGEVTLVHGRLYDLPEDGPNVQRLVARGAEAARGRKTAGWLAPTTPEKGETVVKPKPVALKPQHGADRNMLVDAIKALKDGVTHEDVAAEAQAAAERAREAAAKKAKPAAAAAKTEG